MKEVIHESTCVSELSQQSNSTGKMVYEEFLLNLAGFYACTHPLQRISFLNWLYADRDYIYTYTMYMHMLDILKSEGLNLEANFAFKAWKEFRYSLFE